MDLSDTYSEGYLSVKGGSIYYRQFGKLSLAAPLIVLHGGPGFCHDPLLRLAPLADERPIILYDQLGCGKSDKPTDTRLWTLPRYVEELEQLITHFSLQNYYLLGHSFGACVVLEHALKQLPGLKGLILSSPLISVKDWIEDANFLKKKLPLEVQAIINQHEKAKTTDSLAYQKAAEVFYQHYLCRLKPLPEDYLQAKKKFNQALYHWMWGPSEFNCQGNLKNYERAEQLGRIRCPTLLMCGRYDEARPETLEKYRACLLKGTHHIFENSAHASYMEETDSYLKVLRQWLASTDLSAATL